MSSSFNLSVVNIASEAATPKINQIAALYGCGDNSLSVLLTDANGNKFYGCHAFWKPEDYATFTDPDLRQLIVPADLQPYLLELYERLLLDGDAQVNWKAALAELSLTVVTEESA